MWWFLLLHFYYYFSFLLSKSFIVVFYSLDKGVELDCQWIEFDDVRFNVQVIFLDSYTLITVFGQLELT